MSDRLNDILKKVQTIMDQFIYPLDARYHNKEWVSVVPFLEEIREKVKQAGL